MFHLFISNSWLSIKVLIKCELIYKPQSPLPTIRSSRDTSRHSPLPQRQACSEYRYLGTQTQVPPGFGLCRSVDLSPSLPMGSFFVSLFVSACFTVFCSSASGPASLQIPFLFLQLLRLCFSDFVSLSYVSTSLCLWWPISCSCIFGPPQSLGLFLCLCVPSDSGLLGYDFVSLWLRVSAPRPGPDFNWPPLPIISLESASIL